MIVYFDESYDGGHNFLILAAIFNPRPRAIHRAFLDAKRQLGFVDANGTTKEIKYSYCSNYYMMNVARRAVDCFAESDSWFRAIVIDQRHESGFDLGHFGRPYEPKALKEARAYKKFTEMLLRDNCADITNGTLLTDRMTRATGDAFLELIADLFGNIGSGYSTDSQPVFSSVSEVDTALEQYHVGQIGDILQGVVLNELIPTKNRHKRRLREYVKNRLGLTSLLPEYWDRLAKWEKDRDHHKYQLWYWKPTR